MTEPTYRFPHAEVETPLGTVRVWSTGAEHVGVSGPDTYTDGFRTSAITIRGVPYTLRLDLHPAAYHVEHAEGRAWEADSADAYPYPFDSQRTSGGGYYLGAVYMTRTDTYKDASEAAERKALDVIVPAVNAFLETDEGRAMVAAGKAEHHAQAVKRITDRIAELEAELEAERAKLDTTGGME